MQTLPAVHLNGSGLGNLMVQREKVLHQLSEAIRALYGATPHMRDYYVLADPDASFRAAIALHDSRIAALQAVYDDIMQECEALLESVGK